MCCERRFSLCTAYAALKDHPVSVIAFFWTCAYEKNNIWCDFFLCVCELIFIFIFIPFLSPWFFYILELFSFQHLIFKIKLYPIFFQPGWYSFSFRLTLLISQNSLIFLPPARFCVLFLENCIFSNFQWNCDELMLFLAFHLLNFVINCFTFLVWSGLLSIL